MKIAMPIAWPTKITTVQSPKFTEFGFGVFCPIVLSKLSPMAAPVLDCGKRDVLEKIDTECPTSHTAGNRGRASNPTSETRQWLERCWLKAAASNGHAASYHLASRGHKHRRINSKHVQGMGNTAEGVNECIYAFCGRPLKIIRQWSAWFLLCLLRGLR
jgi:hypothetical protein